MVQYKLIYFALKGRAEVARTLFHMAGQEYDEKDYTFEEWSSVKKTLPFHQAPVLEVTENSTTYRIAQSHAIERFLASRFHLFGKDDLERAQIDMIGEQIVDLFNALILIYRKKDSDEKKTELDEALRERVPNGLKLIQDLLDANSHGNGYLVGDSISLVDIQLINFYDWVRDSLGQNVANTMILTKLPSLKKHEELVKSHPKVAEQLKKSANMRLTILFPN